VYDVGIIESRLLECVFVKMNGPISDRLRNQLDKDDEAWTPPRDQSEPVPTPLPKDRDGWSVTGRGGDEAR